MAEEMKARGLSLQETANGLGLNEDALQRLLCGGQPLTAEVADSIERFLGTKAYIWLALEERYREELAWKAEIESGSEARAGAG